jgi:hypothetical protein
VLEEVKTYHNLGALARAGLKAMHEITAKQDQSPGSTRIITGLIGEHALGSSFGKHIAEISVERDRTHRIQGTEIICATEYTTGMYMGK